MKVEIKMKVEISIYDEISVAFGRPELDMVAVIVLDTTNDDSAAELIEFAESRFEMGQHRQPATNYHAGLRMMYLGLLSAYWFHGEPLVKAKIIK